MNGMTSISGKRFFDWNRDYRLLRKTMAVRFGKERAAAAFSFAAAELDRLKMQYPGLSKGEGSHVYGYILPRVAAYRGMKRQLGSEAMVLMDEFIAEQGKKASAALGAVSALPGMEKVLLKLFRWMAEGRFGPKGGFRRRFCPTGPEEVRFEILHCPYNHYCRLCQCPELIHTFCDSDRYVFGGLSQLVFTRQETLETGEKCDFSLKLE